MFTTDPKQHPQAVLERLQLHLSVWIGAVADAWANVLVAVHHDGSSRVLAFFPAPAGSVTDSVATCGTKGPDGALYVGELLGGLFAPGGACVWRVDIDHGKVTKSIWAAGLTTIQGCGFDWRGNFFATEFEVDGPDSQPTRRGGQDRPQRGPDRARGGQAVLAVRVR